MLGGSDMLDKAQIEKSVLYPAFLLLGNKKTGGCERIYLRIISCYDRVTFWRKRLTDNPLRGREEIWRLRAKKTYSS